MFVCGALMCFCVSHTNYNAWIYILTTVASNFNYIATHIVKVSESTPSKYMNRFQDTALVRLIKQS